MNRILKNFFDSFRKNLKTIITAVIISAVLWVAISLQIFPDVSQTITDIPVRIIPTGYMIEHGLRLAESYEFTTSVRVEGQRRDIVRLDGNDFEAQLDLSDVTAAGDHTVEVIITPVSQVNFEITSAARTETVKVEQIAIKTLEVIAKADMINVVEGMRVDESGLLVSPLTVTIRGEKSLIDSIERAEVQAVFGEEMIRTLEVGGRLALFNYDGIEVVNPEIVRDNTSFAVTVPIHRVRTLELRYLITGAPSNFNMSGLTDRMVIVPEELTLSAPNTSIDFLTHFDVGEIPLNDIDLHMLHGIYRDTFAPKLADAGYKNISQIPSFALQFTGVEDYAQYEFPVPRENITMLNRPAGYNVDILTQELTVTIVGPSAYVRAMSVNDIFVTLNLLGTEISTEARIDSKAVQCRIRGTRVPAWVVGYPRIDVSFTRIESNAN
jgi:hypothetical protein